MTNSAGSERGSVNESFTQQSQPAGNFRAGHWDNKNSPQLMFPVTKTRKRYHPKEQVLGVEINGYFKVYPFVELEKQMVLSLIRSTVGIC